jgi:hypothetical protein
MRTCRFGRRHPHQRGPRCRHRSRRRPHRRSGPGCRRCRYQGRILISLDLGLGDIRAYPPGSHAGIVVLRVPDQSAATVTKTISDLASLTELASLAGSVAVLQRGLLRIRHP